MARARAITAALVLAACLAPAGVAGSAASSSAAADSAPARAGAALPLGDWTTFDYNSQRSGVGPADTGITARNLSSLRRIAVRLPGTVDSSAVELAGVTVRGARHDVAIVTTSYGRTLAIALRSGRILWDFAPRSVRRLQDGPQITTASPVLDPSRRFVYVASPDGFIHKLTVAAGRQLWRTRVTHDPTREKIAGGLNLADGELIVVTGGYDGDAPPYQGHVVTISPAGGRITHVFNTLCSNVATLIAPPSRCAGSDSAIWGRPGSVVEPDTGNILVATGNGPFDGRTNWGDSVLELSPSLKLLHNWTPPNQAQLNSNDTDLGSTEPALLPFQRGVRLAVQGGKQGLLHLLDLNALDGGRGPAGPRLGGALQAIPGPAHAEIYGQPAVWRAPTGRVYVFVSDNSGTSAYWLTGAGRLRVAWQSSEAGTSPVLAGGLLYVYNQQRGALDVFGPVSGRLYRALPAAAGHWNSPIVVGGRIVLPVGNDNDHLSRGVLYIYHLPGA
ncbi:MAG: PQQ-binding-like beta-propeller repeat protein [Acidobacteriota bacterium]|nr:PQQ-binding-like beta-propeller repeat protein [Acidobacteriota bacterium]